MASAKITAYICPTCGDLSIHEVACSRHQGSGYGSQKFVEMDEIVIRISDLSDEHAELVRSAANGGKR